MAGTVTYPSRSSLTPSWPPSGLKGWTSNPHKRGLCRNRRVQTACKFSREDEGSREVDGLRSAQALVSIGFGPATSAMGRSAFLVGVASSPSGRGQTLPLQEQTRASGMIYNCSTSAPFLKDGTQKCASDASADLEVVPTPTASLCDSTGQ